MIVLIAEDDENSRVLLENVLTDSGYQVSSAENGDEALGMIRDGLRPDIVISDILMPKMDGYTFCRELKSRPEFSAVPFIFYTATYTDAKDAQFGLNLGAARYLLKPMDMEDLLKEIRAAREENYSQQPEQDDPAPSPPADSREELKMEQEYSEILSAKLNKKVRELEAERDRLQESEQKYRRLVEALRDNYFFYALDLEGRFTYISPSMSKVLGYPVDEYPAAFNDFLERFLLDTPLNQGVHFPYDYSKVGGKKSSREIEVRHRNGQVVRLDISEEPVHDNTGKIVGVEGIAHDITARHETKKSLIEAKDEWEKTYHAIDDPVLILDSQLRVTKANRATATLFGKKTELLLGSHCFHLFCDGNEPCQKCPVALTLNDGLPHYAEIEHQKLAKIFLVTASPKFDSRGEIAGIVHTVKDITEQKQLERQLQQAQRMEAIGLMASGVAHDLNNILAGVVSYPELILLKLPADSELRQPVQAIMDSGVRAATVVADLLTIARGAAATRESVDINVFVDNYLRSPECDKLKALYPQIHFSAELKAEQLAITCSPVHVQKCILNLLTNAVEAINQAGTVTISTRNESLVGSSNIGLGLQAGNYVVLSVEDTGSGISTEDLEHIFEPFYTRKKMGRSGTGLGLSVVWNTMQDHEGEVLVESSSRGTTFQLFFPASRESFSSSEQVGKAVFASGSNEHILVVDDELIIRDIVQQMLQVLGYKVDVVESGEQALAFIRQTPVDLVILDMQMEPGMNGYQTYRKMLTFNPGQRAIIASGFSESQDVKAALDLGAAQYIKKPFAMKLLAQTIREALQVEAGA